jgi:hypothetical protein
MTPTPAPKKGVRNPCLVLIPASPGRPGKAGVAPARYSGGDGTRPRPDPVPAGMSGRAALVRGAAAVAVFAVAFAVGNALGEDERPAAPHAPARQATTAALGPLRLEPAPALPELRAVPKSKPTRPPAALARPGPAMPTAPAVESEGVPAETGGYSAPTPTPPVSSPAPAEPPPKAPAPPPSEPPPSSTDAPQSAAPAPDPAPAPAPVPTPDPSPSGGSGQFAGP